MELKKILQKIIEHEFDIPPTHLFDGRKLRKSAEPRFVFWYIVHKFLGESYEAIAGYCCYDLSSVKYGVNRAVELMQVDFYLKKKVKKIENFFD